MNKLFAILALITVIGTGFFGVCSIQHASMGVDEMEDAVQLSYSFGDSQCPLSNIFDYQTLDKYSLVDPTVFWRNVTPSAERHLIATKFTNFSVFVHKTQQAPSEQRRDAPDLSVSIISPPLKEAFSRGILNPKKFSIA